MIDPKGWPERGVDGLQSNTSAPSQKQADSQAACKVGSSSQSATDAARLRGAAENADASAQTSGQGGAAERGVTATATESPSLRGAGAAAPSSPTGADIASANPDAAVSFDAVPARPNPFASRPMPAGIGAQKPADQAFPANDFSGGNEMDVADIFGSFGVSFDSVQEE